MCGIIGYIGKNNAVPYLLHGLKKLEYRGYDSSGIALINENGISVLKRQGKISALEEAVTPSFSAKAGIGHTRWATHGEPSQHNAHPHLSENGMFAVVHNGIIENCDKIKSLLKKEGYCFLSDTDTEVISQLLERNYNGSLIPCLVSTMASLEGSFALGILHRDFPDRIICAKKDSPLLLAKNESGTFIFSDSVAASDSIDEYYSLEDGELATLTKDSISFFDSTGSAIEKSPHKIFGSETASEKGGFSHYMLKEIYEQPKALRDTLSAYIESGNIVFPDFHIDKKDAKLIDRIYLVACGSAYHAALCAKYVLREMTGACVSAEIASEFRYDSVVLSENSLVVAISQSGETADTLAALKKAKSNNAKTLAIVNVRNSAIAKEADSVIYTLAGTEISVATTKAYTCQVAVLYLLAAFLGNKTGFLSPEQCRDFSQELSSAPEKLENELRLNDTARLAAEKLKNSEHIYFIGRNTDYALSMEGALKMKEISYIHCEAYPAGELKHGTISLIEKGTPVIALCFRRDIFKKTLSAIKEVKARGAWVLALTVKQLEDELCDADMLITLESSSKDNHTALPGALPLQLMSYHTALLRGCDIDKPRNLAKSVTVE